MDGFKEAGMLGRIGAGLACVMAIAAGAPATARAEIVFDHGADLYAADDDGSGAHLLVPAARLGMDWLGAPALAPGGDTLLFTGSFTGNEQCSHTCQYGAHATGVYTLRGGRVTRLSAAPAPYPAGGVPFTGEDLVPEPTGDGRFVYQAEQCVQYFDSGALVWTTGCSNALTIAPLSGGATTGFASECDDDTVAGAGLGDPSPDPADASRLAYVGCQTPYNPLRTQKGEIIVAGPDHQDASVVATGADGSGFTDPSWSPDGGTLVAYNQGGRIDDLDTDFHAVVTPGLYLYDPADGLDPAQSQNPGTLLVAAPTDGGDIVPLASPRFTGPDRIAFAAGGSLWSVPASCRDCTIDDATQLYDGGSDAASALAWTTSTIAPATAFPAPPSGGGSGGGTGGGGTGTGGGVVHPTPTPTPLPTPAPDVTAPRVTRLRSVHVRSGHAAKIRFALSEPATVAVSLQRARAGRRRGHRCVRATHALRHHHRCTRWVAAGRLAGVPLAAGADTVRLPAKLRHRKLRRGRYRIVLAAVDAAGNRGTAHATLSVR